MKNVSQAQYYALLEVAENGERFGLEGLNIRVATLASLIKKNWIANDGGKPIVTSAGWAALGA